MSAELSQFVENRLKNVFAVECGDFFCNFWQTIHSATN